MFFAVTTSERENESIRASGVSKKIERKVPDSKLRSFCCAVHTGPSFLFLSSEF